MLGDDYHVVDRILLRQNLAYLAHSDDITLTISLLRSASVQSLTRGGIDRALRDRIDKQSDIRNVAIKP